MNETKRLHYFARFMFAVISVIYTSVFISVISSLSVSGFNYIFAVCVTFYVFLFVKSLKADRNRSKSPYRLSIIKRLYWVPMPLTLWILTIVQFKNGFDVLNGLIFFFLTVLLYKLSKPLWSKMSIWEVSVYNREVIFYGKKKNELLKIPLNDPDVRISNPLQNMPGLNGTIIEYQGKKHRISVDIQQFYDLCDTLFRQWEYAKNNEKSATF
jgi:amino acid transporter